jgi:hypothetical protein
MGEWRRRPTTYLKPNTLTCDLTGAPLANRYWQAEVDGRTYHFVDENAERVFRSYWLPRHGHHKEVKV